MLSKRIIPCLDVHAGRVVKCCKLEEPPTDEDFQTEIMASGLNPAALSRSEVGPFPD